MARHLPPTFSQDVNDVLAGPLIHKLAADLAGHFMRRRRHPLAMHLGYLALQRSIGSGNRLDAELGAGGAWPRIVAAYNQGTTSFGDGRTIGAHLPPLTADTFRHVRNTLTDDSCLPRLLDSLTERSIETAIGIGLLPATGGSLTHPHPSRTVYGDGTIVRPLYRPDTPGRTDPDSAQHHNHEGAHWGTNIVLACVRGPQPHRRVILGIDRVEQPGREADTAVGLFRSIVPRTDGRVQAIVYDGAFRGVHHNQLMRELGVVVITKVHAASRRTTRNSYAPSRSASATISPTTAPAATRWSSMTAPSTRPSSTPPANTTCQHRCCANRSGAPAQPETATGSRSASSSSAPAAPSPHGSPPTPTPTSSACCPKPTPTSPTSTACETTPSRATPPTRPPSPSAARPRWDGDGNSSTPPDGRSWSTAGPTDVTAPSWHPPPTRPADPAPPPWTRCLDPLKHPHPPCRQTQLERATPPQPCSATP